MNVNQRVRKRFAFLLAAMICGAASSLSHAQEYSSPSAYGSNGFSLERWEEDYSYLKDATANGDVFDPIKYVPINRARDVYTSFGGQARYRYDYFNNRDFGPGVNDEDGFHLQRYLLHADVHAGDHLRAFVQINSSFVDGREGGGRYGDADTFDLQQAFIDIKSSDDSNPAFTLRLGRQELIYGAQRFISPDDWRNVRRWFDGAKLSIFIPNDTIDVFVARGMTIQRDEYNDDDAGLVFSGIYNATALPRFIESANSKLEVYLLALNETRHSQGAIDADIYTLGTRFSTKPVPFDFDLETNYQFGDAESSDVHAWSVATEMGYTFPSMALSPRASIGLDIASGSADVGGRFNPLFPPMYNYLGHAYLFGRPNLLDVHLGVDLQLTNDIALFAAQHVYWRQNTHDAVYNITNTIARASGDSDAAYVGNEFDLLLNWQIDRHIDAYIGWAHFFPGDFLSETGASRDVDFVYASVTYTF